MFDAYWPLHCIALHWTALRCIALHCAALHCIALHCIAASWGCVLYWNHQTLWNHCKYFFLSLCLFPSVCFHLWHYRLWSFKSRNTKLERFLHKNQHRKLLNFENWTNGEPQSLAKIRVFKVGKFSGKLIKIEDWIKV